MKKQFILTLILFAACGLAINAQTLFKNDGATITIESGAVLVIEGDLENVNGGTIDNDGRVQLEGDLVNQATFDGSDPNSVVFVGGADSEVTSNGAVFDSVVINKDASYQILLVDDMTIGSTGALRFANDDTYADLGATSSLVMQDGAVIENADDDNYVVTSGTGFLEMNVAASETVDFPVGSNSSEYNPAQLAGTGSHTGDNFSVRVQDSVRADGLTGDAYTNYVVNKTWEINEEVGGGSDVDLTLQFNSADTLGEFNLDFSGVARYDAGDADWDLTADNMDMAAGGDPYTQTRFGVDEFSPFGIAGLPTGFQPTGELLDYVLLDLKVLLAGPYANGTDLMKDDLRTDAVLPDEEPYSAAPINYNHVGFAGGETIEAGVFNDAVDDGDDIVDWLIVELRDVADSVTVLASRAALLQRDGDVVDIDGSSSLKFFRCS